MWGTGVKILLGLYSPHYMRLLSPAHQPHPADFLKWPHNTITSSAPFKIIKLNPEAISASNVQFTLLQTLLIIFWVTSYSLRIPSHNDSNLLQSILASICGELDISICLSIEDFLSLPIKTSFKHWSNRTNNENLLRITGHHWSSSSLLNGCLEEQNSQSVHI